MLGPTGILGDPAGTWEENAGSRWNSLVLLNLGLFFTTTTEIYTLRAEGLLSMVLENCVFAVNIAVDFTAHLQLSKVSVLLKKCYTLVSQQPLLRLYFLFCII